MCVWKYAARLHDVWMVNDRRDVAPPCLETNDLYSPDNHQPNLPSHPANDADALYLNRKDMPSAVLLYLAGTIHNFTQFLQLHIHLFYDFFASIQATLFLHVVFQFLYAVCHNRFCTHKMFVTHGVEYFLSNWH